MKHYLHHCGRQVLKPQQNNYSNWIYSKNKSRVFLCLVLSPTNFLLVRKKYCHIWSRHQGTSMWVMRLSWLAIHSMGLQLHTGACNRSYRNTAHFIKIANIFDTVGIHDPFTIPPIQHIDRLLHSQRYEWRYRNHSLSRQTNFSVRVMTLAPGILRAGWEVAYDMPYIPRTPQLPLGNRYSDEKY